MDLRDISRSRSRISTMDWRPTSRSRSRHPQDQPQYSSSWTDGRMTSGFGDSVNIPGGLSRSLDPNFVLMNEHATSSSIPIPGLATQLRYGTPPLSSSLSSHVHHSAVYEEGTSALPGTGLPYSSSETQGPSSRLSHPELLHHTLSALNSPSQQPNSLPASLGLQNLSRSRPDAQTTSALFSGISKHVRKTSFDHTVTRPSLLLQHDLPLRSGIPC